MRFNDARKMAIAKWLVADGCDFFERRLQLMNLLDWPTRARVEWSQTPMHQASLLDIAICVGMFSPRETEAIHKLIRFKESDK